jgi:hypothetical protein
MVTATPFALLNQKNVWSLSFVLPTKPNYRGLEQMTIHTFSEETSKELRKNDEAMASFIRDALRVCCVEGTKRYGAALVNARSTCKKQEELARMLALKHGIESYVINSDSPCFIKHYDAQGVAHPTDFARVADLFDDFERRAQADSVYRSHVLIADRTADRAVSFRPNPWVGSGGLNGEILLPSDEIHCASLIQGTGWRGITTRTTPRSTCLSRRRPSTGCDSRRSTSTAGSRPTKREASQGSR